MAAQLQTVNKVSRAQPFYPMDPAIRAIFNHHLAMF
jgi:hypothetical protein